MQSGNASPAARKFLAVCSGLETLLLFSAPAFAQNPLPKMAVASKATARGATAKTGRKPAITERLQTMVVTANYTRQPLQEVPGTIAAFDGQNIPKLGITDAMSLASQVPGLLFNREANASVPFLRGIGTPVGQSGDEPSVALYVDGVYLPAGTASLANFNDVSNVEVLKGPQGSLFGRNATGGVVLVSTRDPSSVPSFEAHIDYANYDTTSGSLYATGPLTSALSVNIALYERNQSRGWGTNLLTGRQAYAAWDDGGRVKMLWKPSESLSALLSYDLDVTRAEEGLVYHPAGNSLAAPGISGAPGYYDLDDADSKSVTRQQGMSLKLSDDLGWSRLIGISAWRYTHALQGFAYDPVPLSLAYVDIFNPEKTLTQELRMMSPARSYWRWVVGTFYFNDNAGYEPIHFTGLLFGPAPYLDTYGAQKTISWSAFADTTYPLPKETNLTIGLRFTSDIRTIQAGTVVGGIPGFVAAPNSPQSAKWNKLTYRLILDHHFTAALMGFAGYNVGFKSGIFNTVINPLASIGLPVRPETLIAYTAGEKTELLNHRLEANAEFFYYQDRNIQVNEINGPATLITNAAAATFKGVDLDIAAVPVELLTLSASVEALQGRYGSLPDGQYWVYQPMTGGNCSFGPPNYCGLTEGAPGAPPGFNGITWNLKDDRTVDSPPFSLAMTASYLIPTAAGSITTTLNWSHTGDYYADADNGLGQIAPSSSGNDRQGIVNLLNASIMWTTGDGHWTVRLWGRNLTGQKYWSYAEEDTFTTQYSAAAPRTYGLDLGVHR